MRNYKTYSPSEVSELLNIGLDTIYKELKSGTMPHIRIGTKHLIDEADIQEWFRRKKEMAVAKKKQKTAYSSVRNLTPREIAAKYM